MTIGNVDAWAEVFPEELVPRILDLVWTTWSAFPKPAADEHEVPITRRFKSALKQAKDYIRLPLRIERELPEDDPITAQELGRIDLKFSPAGSALEEVYFAFECKRLNANENGTCRPRAAEYVSEGMLRFVTGQYAAAMRHGGMIGYVLDGDCNRAIRLVGQNITSNRAQLRMQDSDNLSQSGVRSDNPMIRETTHDLGPSRRFRLHHLFLAGLVAERILIPPRTLQGFRDYPPEVMIPRERLMETARRVYRSYGFSPIDTPALEYLEILTGKGGEETDKQLYRFQDHGGRWVGLRFDLTVPLARFAAQHINELGTPFKRYHIASVWRGERPQAGRYREFMQCDFDTIGTRSTAADIETALVIHDLLRAIGIRDFTIRLNNRMLLTGLLQRHGLVERSGAVLRALDKLGKIGPDKVAEEMIAVAGATPEQAREVLKLAEVAGRNDDVLRQVEPLVAGNATGETGLDKLRETLAALAAVGVAEPCVKLDVSIARGLDYYTGTIFETFLNELPSIGSICSGGRYDNLAGLYTNQELPGIGASLGLDRLLAALEKLGLVEKVATPAPVFIPYFDEARLHDYLRLAAALRLAGIGVEVYPEAKKLGQQLKYADHRGFRIALIAGQNEFDAGTCQVKDLQRGERKDVPLAGDYAELIAEVRKVLG